MGSGYAEYAHSVDTTSDGGYIVAGYTNGNGGEVSGYHDNNNFHPDDMWVVKLSGTGAIQWQRCLGGIGQDRATVVHQTSDGGYIVGGSVGSLDGDAIGNLRRGDGWLVKLSSSGNILWQKTYGGNSPDFIHDLKITPDGGCIVVGQATGPIDNDLSSHHGGSDIWVAKIAIDGSLQWQKTIGGSDDDWANSVDLSVDGGYIITGAVKSNNGDVSGNRGQMDLYVVKIDAAGAIQWSKCFGGDYWDYGTCVKQTSDAGYVISGITGSNNGDVSGNRGGADIWVVKLNAAGILEWQRCYGSSGNDNGSAIVISGNGYVVAGHAEALDHDVSCNNEEFWLFRISNTGVIEWQSSFGGNDREIPISLQNTKDGGWILTGYTVSQNLVGTHPNITDTGGDFMVVKFTSPNTTLPPPVISILPNTPAICQGSNLTFTTSVINIGNSTSYRWVKNGQLVGVNNNYGSSNFLDNDTLICSLITNATCSTAGGTVFDTVIIRVYPPVQQLFSIASSTTTICAGAPLLFTSSISNGGTAPLYKWRVNGIIVATGTTFISDTLKNGDLVNCEYSDSTICMATPTLLSNTIQVEVIISTSPEIVISTVSTVVCAGTQILFNAVPRNAGNSPMYQWKLNGANVGTNSPTYSNSTLVNGDRISCLLTADPLLSCLTASTAISDTITMVVTGGAPPTIDVASSANNICYGTAIQFNAIVSDGGNNPTFQWKLNGADVGTNSTSYSNSKLRNGDIIQCLIKPGQDACSLAEILSLPVTMTIYDTSVIRITPSGVTIKYMETIGLSASISGTIRSFQWTPAGQLQNPQSLNPVTIPLTATTNFNLTVVNSEGCVSKSHAIIKVLKQLELMPNGFTPNGDGKNDVFRIPPGYTIELSEFSVFDRWGNMVFTTRDINKGWDGTINGKKSPLGVYVYFIKGTYEGKPIFIKDNIVLVR